MIECENNEEFIIANLSSSVFNETLDLAFNEGEKICFKVDGPGTVHLTGNLLDEDNMPPTGEGFDMLGGSDSEMESEEEEAGDRIKEVVEKPAGKRKKVEEVKSQEVVAKKAKIDPAAVEDSEESEDSDDDDDESGEEGTTDADTTANATTGDDEEDDSEDSDDEDDSEEGEDSKEEVKAKEVKPNQAKKMARQKRWLQQHPRPSQRLRMWQLRLLVLKLQRRIFKLQKLMPKLKLTQKLPKLTR